MDADMRRVVTGHLIRPHQFDRSPLRVLVLGHSFIRRTVDFMKTNIPEYDNFHLKYDQVQVSFLGEGGATIQSMVDKLTTTEVDVVDVVRPELVLIQLGTKELSWHKTRPDRLGEDMKVLIEELLDRRVKRVVICKTLGRSKAGMPVDMPHYNGRVTVYNNWIRQNLTAEPRVEVWNHRGFRLNIAKHVDKKGTHMNKYGQLKIYRSYKGAILYYLGVLRPAIRSDNLLMQ